MLKVFVLFTLLITGCNSMPPEHMPEFSIDYDLYAYFEEFEQEMKKRIDADDIVNIIIEFKQIDQNENSNKTILGVCTTGIGLAPRISIDPRYWAKLSETSRTLLMMHELGHCVLNRAHVAGKNTSIMNPLLISNAVFKQNRDSLIDELFDVNTFNSLSLTHDEHANCNH